MRTLEQIAQRDSSRIQSLDSLSTTMKLNNEASPGPLPPSIVLHFEKKGCYGLCPDYSIDLYSDGLVILKGRSAIDYTGTYEYQVSPDFLMQIEAILNQNTYFDLADQYPESGQILSDLPTSIIRAHFGEQWHTVISNYNRPSNLRQIERALEHILLELPFRKMEKQRVDP